MSNRKSNPLTLVTMIALIVIGGVAAKTLPYVVSRLSYAAEVGRAAAAREQLAVATELSGAFNYAAKALRPSVVSIRSMQTIEAQGSDRDPLQNVPEEFRRFFDDDSLERFLKPGPPRGSIQRGMGSGVIISEDGYILTNNHVVRDADAVTVTMSDERDHKATIVGTDAATDLAVLKIEAAGLVAAPLGNSDDIEVGDWVLAIGSPMGLDQTVTAGIISAKGRSNVRITEFENFIQTDAAINPGNSGGPLVNVQGEVVGINTAIASRTGGNMGIGFAIPSNMAIQVKDAILQNGKVERGWMGAAIQDLTDELANSFGLDSKQGVLIGDVIANGPAAKAGMRAGDVVVELNGKPVKSANELRNSVAALRPGSEARLSIVRDNQSLAIDITIGNRSNLKNMIERRGAAPSTDPAMQDEDELGVTVQTLTPELAARLKVDGNQQGVVVTDVSPGGLGQIGGLGRGDIIIAVGNTKVTDADGFLAAVAKEDLQQGIRLQAMRDGLRRFVFLKAN